MLVNLEPILGLILEINSKNDFIGAKFHPMPRTSTICQCEIVGDQVSFCSVLLKIMRFPEIP